MQADLFVGEWELIPELSLYAFGTPPATGSYTISEAGEGVLRLDVAWTTAGGGTHATAFGGASDGTRQPIRAPGVDGFTLTRIDARTLDSEALNGSVVVAYARRVASADGRLLVVLQQGARPDGSSFQNYQVYRRVGAAV